MKRTIFAIELGEEYGLLNFKNKKKKKKEEEEDASPGAMINLCSCAQLLMTWARPNSAPTVLDLLLFLGHGLS